MAFPKFTPDERPTMENFNAKLQAIYDDAMLAALGGSNQNLLDNAYWVNKDTIINQKRQAQYLNMFEQYGIERWVFMNGCDLTIDDNGILINFPGNSYGGQFIMGQFIELYRPLIGKTLTLSVLLAASSVPVYLYSTFKGDYSNGAYSDTLQGAGLASVTFTVPNNPECLFVGLAASNAASLTCRPIAMKLEPGSVQTLAHQDADENWVLNDLPPDKVLETLKCQRYYRVFSDESRRPINAMDFCPPMRINPVLGTIEIDGITYYTADANL